MDTVKREFQQAFQGSRRSSCQNGQHSVLPKVVLH